MGVLVCYDDFTYDVINDYHLDFLVSTGCIIGYDKCGEWVKTEGHSRHASKFSKEDRRTSPRIQEEAATA